MIKNIFILYFFIFLIGVSGLTFGQSDSGFWVRFNGPNYPIKSMELIQDNKRIKPKSINYFKKVPKGIWHLKIYSEFDNLIDTIIDFSEFTGKEIRLESPFDIQTQSKLDLNDPILNQLQDGDTLFVILSPMTRLSHDVFMIIRSDNQFYGLFENDDSGIIKIKLGSKALSDFSGFEYLIKATDKDEKKGFDCFSVELYFDFILRGTIYRYESFSCQILDFDEIRSKFSSNAL